MDWLELLNQIFDVCIIPLLGILTTYVVKFIQTKSDEIENKVDSELTRKYIDMLSDTISNCVIATNQTYVEALKNQNAFNAEAQREAFRMTYESVMSLLTCEAKEYLSAAYGDLSEYVKYRIEAEVNKNH